MNSFLKELKFRTVGMAIAELITHKGKAFIILILVAVKPKFSNKITIKTISTNIGSKAAIPDLSIKARFFFLNSNSKAPSKTISIKPTVPSRGKAGVRSGKLNPTVCTSCCISHPNNSRSITDGNLVFDAVMSKTYAMRIKTQIVINTTVVIDSVFDKYHLQATLF